ncbi:hypothetical protein [Amycolatopsis vancoresmycina]|uniref:hypothetical protein n=1 Tax=Amycolatopsis vancoresmycina TaxID=208444 RepID=UPI000524DB22|nr:hypothetical protein [Amycolatopsis vancoresmycina]
MTSTETTAPAGRYPYLADAGRQRDQLDWLLAYELGEKPTDWKRDPDVLEQLVSAGYASWSVQGYALTERGRALALRMRRLNQLVDEQQPTEVFAAVPAEPEPVVEQVETEPAEGTLTGVSGTGRHRVVKKTPGWLMVACLAVLAVLDELVTRVAYRIARFVTAHARGLAWFVLGVPALAAGIVLGTTGVLWVIR